MSRSSGRSKVKKPKYTQEAADFDNFIKKECFGDSSIREIKTRLEKLLRLFSVKEEISARLPNGLHFLDVIGYELQDLLANDKNKNRKWREFVLHSLLFNSCFEVKFKIMNVNLESQYNEPIDELSISVGDYLDLVKTLRLQEYALHCLKQLKQQDKLLLMKELIKAEMTKDLMANSLNVDTPQEIVEFILEQLNEDIELMLDEPILWSVLNFVEEVLKHVTDTSELRSHEGRIPFVTRYNKVEYKSHLIEYTIAHDYLLSTLPRITKLLKHFSPDLLTLSDAVGLLLKQIQQLLSSDNNGRHSELLSVLDSLNGAFSERETIQQSLRGQVHGHITKMMEDSPYSKDNRLLRLMTQAKSDNETIRRNSLRDLLDSRFMNEENWRNALTTNQKNYVNELAVDMTSFVLSKFSNMNEQLQTLFRQMLFNIISGPSNSESKEKIIKLVLEDAKNSSQGLITIFGNDEEIRSRLEGELVPLFNQLVPQSFENKNLITSVHKYCAAIPSQFLIKIVDEAIKHKGHAELLLQMLQVARIVARFTLPDGVSMLCQAMMDRMNTTELIQHQNHSVNFINFISLLLANQDKDVISPTEIFHAFARYFNSNATEQRDSALVFDLKILAAFVEADSVKAWMNAPDAWTVLSDLLKILDLYRNKFIGLRLEGEDEEKRPYNYHIIEDVINGLDYLANNLKPKTDQIETLKIFLFNCESLTWMTRLTILSLLESTKIQCPTLANQIDLLNMPPDISQQPPEHPIDVIKSLVDMLLAAISSPVYSDLFLMLMEAKRNADEILNEEDYEGDTHEIQSRDIDFTEALVTGDQRAMDYLNPKLFPQFLFLASAHVIPFCTQKELLVVHELFVRFSEKELLQYRTELFTETLGQSIPNQDISCEISSLCLILRMMAVFSEEELCPNMAYTIDLKHMIKNFVALVEHIERQIRATGSEALIGQLLVVSHRAYELLRGHEREQLYILLLHLVDLAKTAVSVTSIYGKFALTVASTVQQ